MLHSIIPAIKYDNCRQAIDWLCEVFDFSLEFLVDGDGEMVKHAQLMKGSSMIMVGSSDHSEFGSLNVSPRLIGNRVTTSLYVVLDNITPHYHRVCRAGADIVIELTEEDYAEQVTRAVISRATSGHLAPITPSLSGSTLSATLASQDNFKKTIE